MTTRIFDATRRQLDTLHSSRPQWKLLLALWEHVFQEVARGNWSSIVVDIDSDRMPSSPLLAGATIHLSSTAVSNRLRRLLTLITVDYERGFALYADLANRLDPLGLLEAAITQDEQLIGLLANQAGVDALPLQALAQMLAAPTLLASGRQLASFVPADWEVGFCPICGAWASIVELRGLERSRRLRCRRCGGDWIGVEFSCAFCKSNDCTSLALITFDTARRTRSIETCRACSRYIKVMTALRKLSPDEVVLADLSTVEHDFVALDRGFSVPDRPATTFRVTIEATGA